MFTKELLEEYKRLNNILYEEADRILRVKTHLETGKVYNGKIINIEFINNKVEVTVEGDLGCSCCDSEKEYYTFPESYLYTEDWAEVLMSEIKKKQEAERVEKLRLELLKQEEIERKEREEYKRLKKKFEYA